MASSDSDMSSVLLLPYVMGMASAANSNPREVAVFVHPNTQAITLFEGNLDFESILHDISSKDGPLPASKASIDSLPLVRVSDPGQECPICLVEYEVNGAEAHQAKEMPCGHRFHSGCIGKWLGIQGSCPVCRYGMPVEEEGKEIEETEERGWRMIHVVYASGRRHPELPAQHMDMDDIDDH